MHLLTQSALLRALGWSLFNSIWQMALLWLLFDFLMMGLKKAPAHVRHGLALVLLGIGVVWSGLTFVADYFFAGGGPDASPWLNGLFSTRIPGNDSFIQPIRQLINEGLPYCSFLYLLILIYLFVRYCRNYLYCRWIRTTGLSKVSPELRVFVEDTRRQMSIGRRVRIWLSAHVDAPLTLGFLKPVILIPLATISQLTPRQVEAVILHELAHIKRNDYLLNLAIATVEVLFFFNPFSRLLIRDIKREREHCCDDMVMQFRYEPQIYVKALLCLAGSDQHRHQQLTLAVTGENDRLLLQRVRRILNQPKAGNPSRARSIIFLFFALAVAFIALTPPNPGQLLSAQVAVAAPLMPPVTAPPPMFVEGTQMITISLPGKQVAPKEKSKPGSTASPRKQVSSDQLRMDDAEEMEQNDAIATSEVDDPETAQGKFALVNQPEVRSYSISPTITIAPKTSGQELTITNQPFVPSASFSIRYRQDTIHPETLLLAEQIASVRQVEAAIRNIERELERQLKTIQIQLTVLKNQLTEEQVQARKIQKQVLTEQLKLQQECLSKQLELEKKLQRAGHRVIVYI